MTKPTAHAARLKKATIERGRLAAPQANLVEIKAAKLRGELVEAAEVEREWSDVLRTVRAAMLAVNCEKLSLLRYIRARSVD
jgi:phage terminase Nu1 subunit (DNA packaging protein)